MAEEGREKSDAHFTFETDGILVSSPMLVCSICCFFWFVVAIGVSIAFPIAYLNVKNELDEFSSG